jgi:hypothetical protein
MDAVETLLANPQFVQMLRNAIGNYTGIVGSMLNRKLKAEEQNLRFTLTVHDPHYVSGASGYSSVDIVIPTESLLETVAARLAARD